MNDTKVRPLPSGSPRSAWSPGRYRAGALVSSTVLAIVVTLGGAGVADAATSSGVATTVKAGLVEIVSTEAYEGAVAAGTGMILTSDGEILTNNHVIDGATSIKVTVVATGDTYSATVVGTSPTQDVAVIQLKNASGLKTIPLGDSDAVKVGQKVVASGNAGGTGEISTVTGKVTDLDQDITASDDGANAEQLTGLIETNAPIVAGDSGGALAIAGKVIGMNTAASVTNGMSSGTTQSTDYTTAAESYAIPIETALKIAGQIEAGTATSTIHIGVHGMLGVSLATESASQSDSQYGQGSGGYGYGGFGGTYGYNGNAHGDNTYGDNTYGGSTSGSATTTSGALISGVVESGAAEAAGLVAGDTITSVDGTTVSSATDLSTIMAATTAGQKVVVGWTTAAGQTQTATVTLGAAAAD